MLGGLVAVAVASFSIGIGVVAYRGHALDIESQQFVDSAVPAISGKWSSAQLLARAAPELRASVKPDQLKALFDTVSTRLGPMQAYQGASGDALMSYSSDGSSLVQAAYVAHAHFQVGDATFRISLVKRDGRWMIRAFHIDMAPATQTQWRSA
jgi:hypothetical protein